LATAINDAEDVSRTTVASATAGYEHGAAHLAVGLRRVHC